MLREMKQLSDLLREKRMERGGISFDFQESIVEVDKKGRPVEIKAAVRDVSSRMIEDFMLAANETVAQDYFWQDQPFLYRSHEKPDPDRIHRLFYFLRNYGYYLHGGREDIHPKEFQKILAKIAGSAEEIIGNTGLEAKALPERADGVNRHSRNRRRAFHRDRTR